MLDEKVQAKIAEKVSLRAAHSFQSSGYTAEELWGAAWEGAEHGLRAWDEFRGSPQQAFVYLCARTAILDYLRTHDARPDKLGDLVYQLVSPEPAPADGGLETQGRLLLSILQRARMADLGETDPDYIVAGLKWIYRYSNHEIAESNPWLGMDHQQVADRLSYIKRKLGRYDQEAALA